MFNNSVTAQNAIDVNAIITSIATQLDDELVADHVKLAEEFVKKTANLVTGGY